MTTYDMPDEKTLAVNIDQSDSVFDEKQKSMMIFHFHISDDFEILFFTIIF